MRNFVKDKQANESERLKGKRHVQGKNWKDLYEKNFCDPVTLEWFSIQILVNFEIFKLPWNIYLKHYGAQIYFLLTTPLQWDQENHEHLKFLRNVYCVMTNLSKDQDTQSCQSLKLINILACGLVLSSLIGFFLTRQ